MSVNVYSVIWADDECAALEKDVSIREFFDKKNIEVLAYVQTSEALKDKLELFKDRVDAVIVDGNFSRTDVPYLRPEDISGLIHTVSFIELFNVKRDIPFFLYTARKTMLQRLCNNGEIDYFTNNKRLIQKGEIELLANKIVDDVDHIHSVVYMVKKKYQSLLDMAQGVSTQCKEDLYQFLLDEERDNTYDKTTDLFTSLRKVMEHIVDNCRKNQIIPGDVIKTLNNFKDYFCNRRNDDDDRFYYSARFRYRYDKELFPQTIKSSLWGLIDIIQDGSHAGQELTLHVSEYVQDTKCPFVFRACLYQVMDVLRWYNNVLDRIHDGSLRRPLYQNF